MSKKLPTGITKAILEAVPLPNHGGRYTPIAHKTIMDQVDLSLATKNLNVLKHEYSSTIHGNVAVGKVLIDSQDDELEMAFFWGNSYDKSSRFTCSVGAYIKRSDSFMILNNIAKYARKHTGNADQLAIAMINDQINNIENYSSQLIQVKEQLKNSAVSNHQMAEIAGVLFIEKNVLNKEQLSHLKSLLDKRTTVTDNFNNLWNFYCLASMCIRSGHPKTWFEDQMGMLDYIANYTNHVTLNTNTTKEKSEETFVDENQISIFDVIETESTPKEEKLESLPWTTDDNSPFELPEL